MAYPTWRPIAAPNTDSNYANPFANLIKQKNIEDELAADKAYKEATLANADRRMDWEEGADARKVAEAAALRKLENERALTEQSVIDSLGFSKIEPFLKNPVTQKIFQNDPKYKDNPEAQLEFITSLAQANQRQFSDPTILYNNAYRAILKSGGTQTEATAAANRAVSGRGFNPLSADLAKSLFQKVPASNLNVTNVSKALRGGRGGGGSTTPLSSIAGETSIETLNKEFFEAFEIEEDRFEFPGTDARITDPGDLDLIEADVRQLQGEFITELRPTTVLKALGSITDAQDGTTKIDIRDMAGKNRELFLQLGRAIEAKANEGRGSSSTAPGNLSLADLAALQNQQRADIIHFNIITMQQKF